MHSAIKIALGMVVGVGIGAGGFAAWAQKDPTVGVTVNDPPGPMPDPARVTATLPKGARIYATAVAGDQLVLMLDVGGSTEIRTFDAKTLKPSGQLKFSTEP